MDVIADILLISGALGVAFYCFVLSRRLTRFTDLEKGVGGAVAVLSAQVDDLTRALERAQKASASSGEELRELTARAEGVSRKLELHVASLHDLTDAVPEAPPAAAPAFEPSQTPEQAAAPAPALAPEPAAQPVASVAPEPEPEPVVEPAPAAKPALQAAPRVQSFFSLGRTPREAL
ncbi:hypothetical protein [Palleronia sp. LCG004]|uniref:hypothetical protein n=1 Tax=Palleronia sp. LCG004 TaxID=3079304 RepID=UPI0029437148|nr:hypothetical protein [Palleronia sp. LCG004]WOI56179.1 hypothetical protein RVY76_14295 [Palleronia sp. LCG004]